jgi:hypothetical protein
LQDFHHSTGSINKKASREKEVRKPGRQLKIRLLYNLDAFTNPRRHNQLNERLPRTPYHQ